MSELRVAAQQALEAMEYNRLDVGKFNRINAACRALRAALAEPVQEPVGYFSVNDYGRWEENENEYGEPLYAAPPQRKPLSEDEVINIGKEARAVEGPHILPVTFARAIERAHGIGGKA